MIDGLPVEVKVATGAGIVQGI